MSTPTGDGPRAASGGPADGTPRGTADDTPRVTHHSDRAAGRDRGPTTRDPMDRTSVVNREKNAHGGVKVGSAFFGWLTATGTAVLLTALLAATGTAVGLAGPGTLQDAVGDVQDGAAENAGTIGVAGAVAVLVVLLVAYFCGGYVAGRMARFNGIRQGVAVWVWAIVIAVVVAVVAAVAGSRYDVLGQLNSFPRIPVDAGSLTTGSVIALVAAVVVSLLGAVLGGLAGMWFHRRVDRAGLGR